MNSPILCIVFVAVLALVSASPVANEEDKRQFDNRGSCYINRATYYHGQVFSLEHSRCVKYLCNNGGWNVHEEACDHSGQCRPVNSPYEVECRTYTCTVSRNNGYSYYQVENTRSRCQDYYGRCRNPGEEFAYAINGRLYNRCTCSVQGSGYISYNCRG